MPDLRDTLIEDSHSPGAVPQALRCQWCSVPLAAGITTCPTCGSPGIPDPRLTVPGLTDPETAQPAPAASSPTDASPVDGSKRPEWVYDNGAADAMVETPLSTMSFEDVERRKMQSLTFIGGAVLVCAVLGWLIGPSLLVGPFEQLTGTTVDDLSDLRGMGTMGGLVAGMFIGATGGWVIWSSR